MSMATSLIVTVKMQAIDAAFFNALRTKYYPAYCNFVDAHITLFHKLPTELNLVTELLEKATKRNNLAINVTGIKNVGNSVAYTLECAELVQLHRSLQKKLTSYLTTKDRRKLKPHITIQNKVTAFKAVQTAQFLQENFIQSTIHAIGLSTFLFHKNKWIHQSDYLFEETVLY